MSVMYSYDLTAEGPIQEVDRLEDAIRRGELGDLYNGSVRELPEGSAVRTTAETPLTDKWLKASFLVKDGQKCSCRVLIGWLSGTVPDAGRSSLKQHRSRSKVVYARV